MSGKQLKRLRKKLQAAGFTCTRADWDRGQDEWDRPVFKVTGSSWRRMRRAMRRGEFRLP